MPNLEDYELLIQSHRNFENLRRDMRSNANAYHNSIGQHTLAQIRNRIAADAVEYQRRLVWQRDLWDSVPRRTKLLAAAAVWQIPQSELTGAYQELKAAADIQSAAIIPNTASITTLRDQILAGVPAHDSVFNGS